MLSFSERMAQAKANKPASGGKTYPRPIACRETHDSNWAWCQREMKHWLVVKRGIQNDFAAACLNPINENLEF